MTYYQNYMPIGDVLVLATCIIFWILTHVAYINRTRNFRLFKGMIAILSVAATADLMYNLLLRQLGYVYPFVIYLFRWIYHGALFADMALYTMYLKDPLKLEEKEYKTDLTVVWTAWLFVVLFDIAGTLTRTGFYIDEALTVHLGPNIFPMAYIFFILVPVINVMRHRNEIYFRVILGVLASVGLSITIMMLQGIFNQQSFTASTYLFPLYALLYLLHATPYDVDIGAVNRDAFDHMVTDSHTRKKDIFMMSLYMPDYEKSTKKFPRRMQVVIREFTTDFFVDAHLYQLSNGRILLSANIDKNKDYVLRMNRMLERFDIEYTQFKIEYKIVGLHTIQNDGDKAYDYFGLIQYIENRMEINEVRIV
ncbi:MAG: hypothetical protein J6N76_05800, partial [Lachnospiraceae bacterium]|nr:hypothetical protein [Lachnospiraceae bacterium]